MSHLTITLVQADLSWEEPAANRDYFDRVLTSVAGTTDLVILPEMFATGFTMAGDEVAETMDGESVAWLKKKAAALKAHLAGSLVIRANGQIYNRLVWATPEGELSHYDKRHLFRMSGEHKVYAAGAKRLTVSIGPWRICPFICYDLRFPVWTRNVENGYDVAVFVANWPAARAAHWKALLPARAIENQAYVLGVNRIGHDGNGHAYAGDTLAIDFQGRVLFDARDRALAHTLTLDRDALETYRRNFPAWRDADAWALTGDAIQDY